MWPKEKYVLSRYDRECDDTWRINAPWPVALHEAWKQLLSMFPAATMRVVDVYPGVVVWEVHVERGDLRQYALMLAPLKDGDTDG